MSDETTLQSGPDTKALEEEQRQAKARAQLNEKLKAKGAQSLSYKEYLALKAKKEKAAQAKIPIQLKFILSTPILLVVCFGVLFIPYILYLIATSKPTVEKKDNTGLESIMKKPSGSSGIQK